MVGSVQSLTMSSWHAWMTLPGSCQEEICREAQAIQEN